MVVILRVHIYSLSLEYIWAKLSRFGDFGPHLRCTERVAQEQSCVVFAYSRYGR